jgi:hypothetical protein
MLIGLALIAALGPLHLRAVEPDLDPVIDWARSHDPQVVLAKPEIVWPESLPLLWRKALEHHEIDVQREAADSITRAHQLGMPVSKELGESLGKALIAVLDQPDQHPIARIAAARALIQIDARQTAELLAKHAASGPLELTQVIEPALAQWDHRPQRDVWLKRLTQGARPALLELAAQGAATVGEERAIPELHRLAKAAREPATVRLSAARALASLQRDGLVELAGQLAKKSGSTAHLDRLVSANLLAHHTSEPALALLEQLADDSEPAVAAQAMQRLLEIAPDRLIARAEKSLIHRDARIRYLTFQALATRPSPESIAQLAPRLSDPVAENRIAVRRILLKMASDKQLHAAVVEHTTQVLQGDAWRGDEQAILILTTLDQRQLTPRYFELLDHARPEVYVTAAWGLRKFAVPELAEPVLAAAEKLSSEIKNNPAAGQRSNKLMHLVETLGVLRYAPADAHLRTYFPKGGTTKTFEDHVRAAAMWSLGLLHDGQPDPELAKQLEERLADMGPIPPEGLDVKAMSAVSLGRMKSESSLPLLRTWYTNAGKHNTDFGRCCGWAIEQLTGEKVPDADPIRHRVQNWFIEPLESP